ncbi:MAG TPA: nucleotidyltransferase [Verrucomicrobiae bacterium]|nr:nucleotidyltransferase [Verrucomicrobiae bacterium]
MPQNDKALLSRLNEKKVEFVIIGGVCGVLHGASLVTLDLDICCQFSRENLRRVESAVKGLHPRHRLTDNKLPLELTDELCDRLKNLYLNTDLGILDCLSEVKGIGDYEQVLKQSVPHSLSYGEFRMLNLDALIVAKSAVGRPKDLDAVKLLNAIKEKTGK